MAWRRHLATPWGRVQSALLRGRLLTWLGARSFDSALDVGCGVADTTLALLPTTRRITCVDRSQAMLDEAQSRVGDSGPVTFVQRDLNDGVADLGSHDLVVCHNVIDYTRDPQRSVAELASCVDGNGWLSLSFGNSASFALRHAVLTHDLGAALALARRSELVGLPGPCGDSARLRRVMVEEWLDDAGIEVAHRAGVRVLTDLLSDEVKSGSNLAVLEELELELGERPELVDIGAIVHLLGYRRDGAA